MSELINSIYRLRSPQKLLQAFEAIKNRMEFLGLSSDKTDPVGQYAEYLVMQLYDAEKMRRGEAGCDLKTKDGRRIEVKGRVARKEAYVPRTYINDSNISGKKFNYLVYIIFNSEYEIQRAYGMSLSTFKKVAKYVEHNNSVPKWRFQAKEELLQHKEVDDLTSELAKLQ